MFSIIIPTWNNLPYIKLCLNSLDKNSSLSNQIIMHINDGSDGTLDWAKKNGFTYTYSPENIGICKAVNMAALEAKADFLIYMNDDMYVLPGWDEALQNEIYNMPHDIFALSGTMIEPRDTGNRSVIVANYGNTIDEFQESKLLRDHLKLNKTDWQGSTWPPLVIPKKYWDRVGGLSDEFSPGMYSDPDLSMKLWMEGCRIFKGCGKSMVYHFQQKSTSKIKANNGRKTFLKKWNMNSSTFIHHFLRMGTDYNGPITEPVKTVRFRWNMLRAKIIKELW